MNAPWSKADVLLLLILLTLLIDLLFVGQPVIR